MLVTKGCSESRMRSRTSQGAPEWSGGKDLYIGSPVLVSGKVSGISGSVLGVTDGFRGTIGRGPPTPGGHMGLRGGAPAPSELDKPATKGPCEEDKGKGKKGQIRKES